MTEYTIVSATRGKKENTKLWKSKDVIDNQGENITWKIVENNVDGLPKVYNKFLETYAFAPGRIAVFVHDDVLIEDAFFLRKLTKAHEEYDVVGLAGGNLKDTVKNMNLKSPHNPALWHLMVKRESMSGNVMHTLGDTRQVMTTPFGPSPKTCQVMDGLFLSVNMDKIGDVRFDEQFKFHHYDMDFTLSATAAKLRVGTWPIHVTHASPGLKSFDERYMKSEELFIKKWAK